MDVHAPHEPIHTTRDFFLHLFTITVGLLIALGLEGLVEAGHHRHLLHTAEANLSVEIRQNRDLIDRDEAQMDGTERILNTDIQTLLALKAHQAVAPSLHFNWQWDSTQAAAWNTARDTGALALMSYDRVQGYSVIYGQQKDVDDQATIYIRDIYRCGEGFQGRQISELQPAELDATIAATQQALVDLKLLRDLSRSLDRIYKDSGSTL
jgi:hypothetical protein